MGDERLTIETERLRIRTPRVDDCEAIAREANDYDIVKMTGRMPYPYGYEDAVDWVQRVTASDGTERSMVIEADGGELAGAIGYFRTDASPHFEVGYWIARPFWGRGVATEALNALLACLKAQGRRAVVAGHFVDNPASGAVLSKAGFLYTGQVEPLMSRARGVEVPSRRMVWLA